MHPFIDHPALVLRQLLTPPLLASVCNTKAALAKVTALGESLANP